MKKRNGERTMDAKNDCKLPATMLLLRSLLFFLLSMVAVLFVSGTFAQRLEHIAPFWPYICVCVNLICLPVIFRLCRHDGMTYSQLIHRDKLKRGLKDQFVIPALSVMIGIVGMYAMAFLVYGTGFLQPADPSLPGMQGFFPHWAPEVAQAAGKNSLQILAVSMN